MKKDLIALTGHTYGHTWRKKGTPYSAHEGEAKILVGLGKAAYATAVSAPVVDDLAALRAEFAELTGKPPHHLRKADSLREEIASIKEKVAEAAAE